MAPSGFAPGDLGERARARRVHHLERRVEQLEHAHRRGARARELRREEPDGHDRHEQEAEVGVEGDQLADGEALAEDLHAPHADDGERAEVGAEVDEREVVRHRLDDAEVVVAQLVVDGAVALGLARLAGEGAHHAQALEVLLKHRVEPPERHLHLAEQRPDATHEHRQQHEDRQQREERHAGEQRVDRHEQRRAAEEHHQRGDELHHAAADEGADLLHVVREAGEELSGVGLIVVAEAEALDVGEQAVAQIEGHALRGALGEVALHEVEEAAPGGDGDQPHHRDDHSVPATGREPAVDGEAHHLRGGKICGSDEEQGHERSCALAAVATQVPERAPHGRTASRAGSCGAGFLHGSANIRGVTWLSMDPSRRGEIRRRAATARELIDRNPRRGRWREGERSSTGGNFNHGGRCRH